MLSLGGVEVLSATIDVRPQHDPHVDGRRERCFGRMAEVAAVLSPLLRNLVGALFLHRLGWFFLDRFLLCHTLSH
jgi:hypothetical protein